MKLAIADPPYPPYADRSKRGNPTYKRSRARRWYTDEGTHSRHAYAADHHPDAADWDTAESHRALLERVHGLYDGWAIATSADGAEYYGQLPRGARTLIWVKPRPMPGGNRIIASYEVVLAYVPDDRRSRNSGPLVPDVLIEPAGAAGFTGSKPPRWTHWVLDALGYDPDADTVDDLFPGSGAVSTAIEHYQAAL